MEEDAWWPRGASRVLKRILWGERHGLATKTGCLPLLLRAAPAAMDWTDATAASAAALAREQRALVWRHFPLPRAVALQLLGGTVSDPAVRFAAAVSLGESSHDT